MRTKTKAPAAAAECRCPNLRVEELRRLEGMEAEVERVREAAYRAMNDADARVGQLMAEVDAAWEAKWHSEQTLLTSISKQHERERGHLQLIEDLRAEVARLSKPTE